MKKKQVLEDTKNPVLDVGIVLFQQINAVNPLLNVVTPMTRCRIDVFVDFGQSIPQLLRVVKTQLDELAFFAWESLNSI